MRSNLSWLPRSEFVRVLDGIDQPYDQCRAFATLSRINTLYMIAKAGSGHIGSSFSAADIVSWLYLRELRRPLASDGDLYFSSKGHDAPGLYSCLIGLGGLPERSLHDLRRISGLPGHPDVHTPHMPFNTGSLGMGIAKAKGVVLADRLGGRARRVYVLTGDGELQEGQNWESLAGAAHRNMGELTVIVDHNKIQSDTWVRDVSDLGDLEAKFTAFGWRVLRCDGHDVHALEATFARRREEFGDAPAVIIADTVKGAGCATFAATTSMPDGDRRYRFHSGAPAAEDYYRALGELVGVVDELLGTHGRSPLALHAIAHTAASKPAGSRLPEVYGRALVELAATNERVVALDADLVLDTGLIPFVERFPDRFVESGIAEQDMVSVAGGLAASNLLPFVHSFSCFLHARPNEQIYNNATEERKVIYVGSLAGVLPGGPGHSHQAVRDVSALGAVPGLLVLEPSSPARTRAAVEFCDTTPNSVYLRLVSTPCAAEVEDLPAVSLVPGIGSVVRRGGSTVAIGSGPVVLTQLLRAAARLHDAGELDLTVVDLPWLNYVDPEWLGALAAGADRVFVVENHYTRGGQADLVARTLLELDLVSPPGMCGIGITGIPRCGTDDEVLTAHGLHADQLADRFARRSTVSAPVRESHHRPRSTS